MVRPLSKLQDCEELLSAWSRVLIGHKATVQVWHVAKYLQNKKSKHNKATESSWAYD